MKLIDYLELGQQMHIIADRFQVVIYNFKASNRTWICQRMDTCKNNHELQHVDYIIVIESTDQQTEMRRASWEAE